MIAGLIIGFVAGVGVALRVRRWWAQRPTWMDEMDEHVTALRESGLL